MKRIQQYCSVVDRLKQDPSCKQEVLARASRKKISVSRRGMITGTAVAAVLLALNIGGGYMLHQSAEESGTVTSETSEELVTAVMTSTTAPGTDITAVVTKVVTDHSAVTKTVTDRQTNTVTTGRQTEQTGTTVPVKTTARPETTAVQTTAVQTTAAQTTETTAQILSTTSAQTTTVPEKTNAAAVTPEAGTAQRAVFDLHPLSRDYRKAEELGLANNVYYAEPGESFMMEFGVRNDPGITNMDLRLTVSPDLGLSNLWPGIEYSEYGKLQQLGTSLYYVNTNPEKQEAKPIASVAIITVTVPEEPGRYTIKPDPSYSNGMYLDPEWGSPAGYVFYGLDIIVGADGTLPAAAEPFTDQTKRTAPSADQTDPERTKYHFGDIQFRYEMAEAQPGEKNVPVRFYLEKNTGFAGAMLKVYDAWGLKPSMEVTDSGYEKVKLDDSDLFGAVQASYNESDMETTIVFSTEDGLETTQVGWVFTLYFDVSDRVKSGQHLVFDLYPIMICDTNGVDITERCETVFGGIRIVDKAKPMRSSGDLPVYSY